MAYIFWVCLAVALYTYVGYPALTLLVGRLRRRTVAQGPYEPTVSIITAARNEAPRIGASLENKLRLDYAPGKVQIIVVSDASTDGTDAIAREAGRGRVLVLRQEPRRGKTAALNMAMEHATGEVLVFADANSMYAPDVLRMLIRNFRDPRVGYVTGRLVYGGSSGTESGCSAYMTYENALRRAETRLGSIIGVNGGIDAVRRSLYVPMRDDQLPDFALPLDVVRQGYRVVYESDAILREDSLTTSSAEYRMRVRVALRAWWTLMEMRELFNVRRYGFFSVQLFSHKALRYLAFIVFPLLYVSAGALASSGLLYRTAFVAGSLFLLLACAGYLIERLGRSMRLVSLPYYFVVINAATGHALFNFMRGRRQSVWTPRLG